ncbi:MAG: hypothetical protein IJ438_09270 [Clostridia bacterium]|nr:hypothetical protein [Clostridia bacterium]
MKNWKNILLTILAIALITVFAWAVPSPSITEDALDSYMELDTEGSTYDFL